MMEIISAKENPVAFAKTLKRYRYDVYALDENLVFQFSQYKPGTWFIYLIFLIGIIRLVQQNFIQASISLILGLTGLLIIYNAKKKYALAYNDIEKVAVAEEGIALSYKDNFQPGVQINKEEVVAISLDHLTVSGQVLGYITLTDIHNTKYNLFIIMDKSHDVVERVSNDIIQSIKGKLGMN